MNWDKGKEKLEKRSVISLIFMFVYLCYLTSKMNEQILMQLSFCLKADVIEIVRR